MAASTADSGTPDSSTPDSGTPDSGEPASTAGAAAATGARTAGSSPEGFSIDRLEIPDSITAHGAHDFVSSVEVRNDIEAEILGTRDLAYAADELLPRWHDPYSPKTLLVARIDGRIVGRGIYETEIAQGAKAAWLTIEVLSGYRRRGIGSAFFARLSALAAADGRSVLQSFAMHGPSSATALHGGGALHAPTGFGSVPRNDPGVRFLVARAFTLEQVARCSRLDLPLDATVLAGYCANATRAAGRDYRVVTWEGRTPPEWRADLALLHQRMSTDAPFAGLEQEEDPWDENRIDSLDLLAESGPRRTMIAAAVHAGSGRLVAFTELGISAASPSRPVAQQDTLVLKEHRGHRLGMLVKTANLLSLSDRHPGHPSVVTFNAEENRPMLAVNEALGFVAIGSEGAWKRAR